MADKTQQVIKLLKDSTYKEIVCVINSLQNIVDVKLKAMKPLQDS